MPTCLSRRRGLPLAAGVMALAIACAGDQRSVCQAIEATKTIDGSTSTFTLDGSPWTVTSSLDAEVTITNRDTKTRCSTSVESVLTAYFGPDAIYLRSSEIASDLLLTLNGATCTHAAPPKTLDGESESRVNEQLLAAGICPG